MQYYPSGRRIGPSQKPQPDNNNKKHKLETDIHDGSGIPTLNPNKRAPQTHALNGAITGTLNFVMLLNRFLIINLNIFYMFLIAIITLMDIIYFIYRI
jgi:hypothetical protein